MFDQTALVVWGVCSGLWSALLTLGGSILWARVKGAEHLAWERVKKLSDEMRELKATVPEARLQEVEACIGAFKTRVDSFVVENDAFRTAVHKSVQRTDQIMRRNERAVIQQAEKTLQNGDDDGTPDEIAWTPPEGDVKPRPTRAQLRELLRRRLKK